MRNWAVRSLFYIPHSWHLLVTTASITSRFPSLSQSAADVSRDRSWLRRLSHGSPGRESLPFTLDHGGKLLLESLLPEATGIFNGSVTLEPRSLVLEALHSLRDGLRTLFLKEKSRLTLDHDLSRRPSRVTNNRTACRLSLCHDQAKVLFSGMYECPRPPDQ